MKRAIALAIFAVVVLGACATAATWVENYFVAGAYLTSVPLVPLNSDPEVVFSDRDGNPVDIDGILSRLEPGAGMVDFSPWSDDFGGVLLGDGLVFQSQGTWVKYQGVDDGIPDGVGQMTDMWIPLPADTTCIGTPFNHSVELIDVMVTDGAQVLSWEEAVAAGWVEPTLTGMDPYGYFDVGIDPWDEYQSMEPWSGYVAKNITSPLKPLALIIPAQ